jgi:hypothetical protein
MTLSFNNVDDPIDPTHTLEDASDEEEVTFETAYEGAEEEMDEERSVISASEYDLDAGELPERLLFAEFECRAIFTLKSDHGKFHRVCGCRAEDCSREGHAALRLSLQGRAPEGTYVPVRARKFVDGRYATHLPKAEFFANMEALQKDRRAGVRAAAGILQESPTGSEELAYQQAHHFEDEKVTMKRSSPRVLRSTRVKYPTTPVRGPTNVDSKPAARPAKADLPVAVPKPVGMTANDQQTAMMTKMMADFSQMMVKTLRAELSPGGTPVATATAPTHNVAKAPAILSASTGVPVKHWYAVINGKGGVNSVFPEWIGGAAPYVTGVSGALSKKFNDFNDAWSHVESHVATTKRLLEADTAAADTAAAMAKTTATNTAADLARSAAMAILNPAPPNPVSHPRPPLSLIGPDPSTKKEEELFGFEYGSEIEARTNMCPPGLGPDHAKSLTNAVVDVVALPGGFTGGTDEKEGSDLAMMSAALEELVHQGRSTTESSMKSDLQWRSDKRTGLRSVQDPTALGKRLKDLLKLRDRVIKNMIRATVNVLKRAGWSDMDAINAWAVGGYFTKMIRDSMDAWIALHQHLLGMATTENVPWDYVQVEISHHVEELELLRNTQDSRLQALCANYIYLRDGHAGSWHSTSLQYKRNAEIFSKVAESDYCRPFAEHAGGAVKSFPGCGHCGTILHTGGKLQCPWKKFSKKKAKVKANATLLALADGAGAPSDGDDSS